MSRIEHFVAGPAGKLQLLEEGPDQEVTAVAVVCHPHSLHGGSLNNKVVHQLARAFVELGAVSIRFNFRGVGHSEGRFDRGEGELEDLQAVVRWARQRWPGRPLWLAGFSFGGFVAIKGAQRLQADWLVTAAPAVTYFPSQTLSPPTVPWLLIQGADDDVVPAEQVLRWLEGQEIEPRLVVLEDVGHFFHGRLNDLKRAVLEAAGAG